MRRLVICAAFSVLFATSAAFESATAESSVKSLSATVASNVKSVVAKHWAGDKSCQAQHIVVSFTAPPANGTVTAQYEQMVVPAYASLGGAQGSCAERTVEGIVIYYQSKPGFSGQDSFRYLRTNVENVQDRLNGEISYTVTVQ